MKKSRFTESQIIEAIKRVEAGLAVPQLCRKLSIRPIHALMAPIVNLRLSRLNGRFGRPLSR